MSKRLHTIPQLDSIRCIAAFVVIFHHYLSDYRIYNFSAGKHGVDIFFVISGYLITAILLEQKDTEKPRIYLVKNFIIKRALRIFPIYYLVLIFWSCAAYYGKGCWEKGDAIYYYTYTSNILFYLKGFRGIQLNHTWTLAVEEQFYLFWPWIILFMPKKKEVWIILLFIIFSFASDVMFDFDKFNLLTISNLDTLGIGALIAYLIKYKHTFLIDIFYKFRTPILIITSVLLVSEDYWILPKMVHYLCLLALPSVLVIGCYYEFKGPFGYFLNIKAIKYLGKISYGLYLYHMFMPYIFFFIVRRFVHVYINDKIMIVGAIGLTILTSYLSYTFIEKKFIRLKAKYDV